MPAVANSRPGWTAARALACWLESALEPVMIICTTPACAARARTCSRSASKLSCVRLMPMSIRGAPAVLSAGSVARDWLPRVLSFAMRRRFYRAWGVATCLSLSAADVPAAAELNWLDIESRIQYAYYTQDLRALHGVLE